MKIVYPEPCELGIKIPCHLISRRFCGGFLHALQGGHLTEVDQLRLSFREGYRAGKLYLRKVRRKQGIIEFPFKGKLIFKAVY